jgi:DNA-directed RNA polymerase subunit RPC12/RpoP
MFKCDNCGAIIEDDEVEYERVCWEDYYGVGGMFPNKNYGTLAVCPACGSEDIEEMEDDDEDDDE